LTLVFKLIHRSKNLPKRYDLNYLLKPIRKEDLLKSAIVGRVLSEEENAVSDYRRHMDVVISKERLV
jgi:hypothetical protein